MTSSSRAMSAIPNEEQPILEALIKYVIIPPIRAYLTLLLQYPKSSDGPQKGQQHLRETS